MNSIKNYKGKGKKTEIANRPITEVVQDTIPTAPNVEQASEQVHSEPSLPNTQIVWDDQNKDIIIRPSNVSSITKPLIEEYNEGIREQNAYLSNIYSNLKHTHSEKKWMIALVVAVVAILITNTFTISMIDHFLFSLGIDLFQKHTRQHELILLLMQFLIIFIIIRWILTYYK